MSRKEEQQEYLDEVGRLLRPVLRKYQLDLLGLPDQPHNTLFELSKRQ